MYEELISRLKNLATLTTENGDSEIRISAEAVHAIREIATEAADAIEELQQISEHYKGCAEDWYKEACDYKAMLPRWIPVTERLPKTRESILGKKSSKVIVAFHFNDGTQGTDTAHTLNGEWTFEDHITVVARTVNHWMPLPAPPKEET